MLFTSKTQGKTGSTNSLKEDHLNSEIVALLEVTGKVIVTTFSTLSQETNVFKKESPSAKSQKSPSVKVSCF